MKKTLLILIIILAVIVLAIIIFFSWLRSCPEGEEFGLNKCSCAYGCSQKTEKPTFSCARSCGAGEIKYEKLQKLFDNE